MSVEVVVFDRPCPHCQQPLKRVIKLYFSFYECENQECPYLASQTRVLADSEDAIPFTCIKNNR
jgi:hypothetical protein